MTAHWLVAHLERIGVWNADGVGRRLSPGTCPRCRARVLRGLDGDRAAGAATVDPHPVDAAGELAALLAGRVTYSAWQTKGGIELERRDEWSVATPPSRRNPVLVAHACGARIPTAEYAQPISPANSPVNSHDGNEVPF